MNIGWSCCYVPWQKVTALPTAHTGSRNIRFGVPMHFKNNRFTFKKFPPAPPLLHPNKLCGASEGPEASVPVSQKKRRFGTKMHVEAWISHTPWADLNVRGVQWCILLQAFDSRITSLNKIAASSSFSWITAEIFKLYASFG